jgi:hypothetical protein
LSHAVEGRSSLEPCEEKETRISQFSGSSILRDDGEKKQVPTSYLAFVESVRKFQVLCLAVLVVKAEGNGRSFGEFSDTDEVDLVVGLDLVVVGRVGEVEREHTLLLEVSLVDTSERTSDDSSSSEETGFESGVFTGRSFSVVLYIQRTVSLLRDNGRDGRNAERETKGKKGN